jgi:SnoaL-like domain
VEAWELVAREQIRDTIARYAHCVDGGRFDELVELFAPDGVLEVEGERPHQGRDAIRAFVSGTGRDLAAETGAPRIRHHVDSVLIELDGEVRARARCYFLAVTERGVDHWAAIRTTSRVSGNCGGSCTGGSAPTAPRRAAGPPAGSGAEPGTIGGAD